MITSVDVKGLNELLKKMHALPEAFQKHLVKAACATAVAVIRDEAVRLAPEWTGPVSVGHPPPGTLKRAIYQIRMNADCTPTLEVWKVSVHKGNLYAKAASGNRDAYYASWVEFGHYTRGPTARNAAARRDVANGTAVPLGTHYVLPHPFMRPAFEAKQAEAVRAMRDYIAANLDEVVRRT